MIREEAEDAVWREWGEVSASEFGLGCAVRIDTSRTEEHEWGWVVTFVPVRREECRRHSILRCYAIASETGRSYPVGSKGLDHTLRQMGVLPPIKGRPLTPAELVAFQARGGPVPSGQQALLPGHLPPNGSLNGEPGT
jgi:hypothetical protein